METVPPEVVAIIFSFGCSGWKTTSAVDSTCKKFREIIKYYGIWKTLFIARWGEIGWVEKENAKSQYIKNLRRDFQGYRQSQLRVNHCGQFEEKEKESTKSWKESIEKLKKKLTLECHKDVNVMMWGGKRTLTQLYSGSDPEQGQTWFAKFVFCIYHLRTWQFGGVNSVLLAPKDDITTLHFIQQETSPVELGEGENVVDIGITHQNMAQLKNSLSHLLVQSQSNVETPQVTDEEHSINFSKIFHSRVVHFLADGLLDNEDFLQKVIELFYVFYPGLIVGVSDPTAEKEKEEEAQPTRSNRLRYGRGLKKTNFPATKTGFSEDTLGLDKDNNERVLFKKMLDYSTYQKRAGYSGWTKEEGKAMFVVTSTRVFLRLNMLYRESVRGRAYS